ncbi:outer membrane receptor protein involved in Fe transport [Tenacibaculum gallaicum]|uniref:Outer membrane receptor protein involved in Fe transport n=1 Tax=Tenacibaculum gallaicum TaxID=561505 RepID=A0A3E0I1Q1_9FLAO|nr:outer membrane beta-barrel family protein [Tenacibaculum gallaicum]REH52480.1 outer membrane receptor protein involved in Fe transport [Tenacibaculum gallaicum]
MKRLLILLSFLGTYFCQAQNLQLTGTILDKKNNHPLPFVTITCKNTSNKILTGSISDKNGNFKIEKLPKDSLLLSFQFIGYKTFEKKINLKEHNKIETIFLEENTTQLDEVEIQGETSTIIQKIDRKVINVGNDLTATGATSLEMLENIPSIDINQLSGTISLRGNENVRVLVNGKPSNISTAQLLKQIPSNSVKSVEIITNPSAKHTPEGMSGIINLILKKNTKIGFNGNLSVGATQSRNLRPEISLNTNYKTGITNFHLNYNASWGDYETFNDLERTDIDLTQNIDFLSASVNHNIKFGVDIDITSKSVLSMYTSQNFDNNSLITNTLVHENNSLIFDNKSFSDYNQKDRTYNIDYVYHFDDKGQNLEIEFNHSTTKNPEKTTNEEFITPNSKEYNYTNNIKDTRKLWLLNIDYVKPIKSGKLEFGIEFRKQDFYNQILTDREAINDSATLQPVGNTYLDYDRSIYSGYINFNKKFNKFAIQTGIRLEQFNLNALFSNTEQGNTSLKDNIFSWYPSASITYNFTKKDNLQFAYSRRVDRPSAYQVTPIQEWFSPLTISKGNLNLQPQFTNSLELNYTKTITKGYVSFGTFYRRTNDKIGRLLQQDNQNPDRTISSFTNYDFADSYGIELSASFKPLKWWTLRPSFETYIQDSQGILNNNLETVKNTLVKGRISNSFKASKKLSFQLSGVFRGKSENIQYSVQPYTMVNIGARLKIFDGKGSLTLRGTDIFNNVNFDYTSNTPFIQKGKYTLEYNSIYLGFSYNFGSGKNKSKGRKYRDSNEAQGGMF